MKPGIVGAVAIESERETAISAVNVEDPERKDVFP